MKQLTGYLHLIALGIWISMVFSNEIKAQTLITIPSNGHYCSGSPGVAIGIENSSTGQVYQLYKVGSAGPFASVVGNGSTVYFSGNFIMGNYYSFPSTNTLTVIMDLSPIANYNFSPANTNPPICASTPFYFTDNSVISPGASIISRFWYFDDPASGSNNLSYLQNPSHIFEAYGNSVQGFLVKLRIIDNNGCSDSIEQPIEVRQKPDASLSAEGFPYGTTSFANCLISPPGLITFYNASSTVQTNTNYSVDWGLCAQPANFNSTVFNDPVQVGYSCFGSSQVVNTVTGMNGCTTTKVYEVFNGGYPSGGLSVSSGIYGAAPFTTQFALSPGAFYNTPGTIYHLDFGDGTVMIFNQESLPPDGLIPHTFYTCPSTPNGNGQYGFTVALSVENPCGQTVSQIFPVVVCCPTLGDFNVAEGSCSAEPGWFSGDTDPSHLVGCNTVTFTNSTQAGFYIAPNGTSSSSALNYRWNFGDPSSGTSNISNLPQPAHTFSTPGYTYTVTLITWTGPSASPNLTADTVIKHIYIQAPPSAAFTTDASTSTTLAPRLVKTNNLSDAGGLGNPCYQWRVRDAGNMELITTGFSIVTPGHIGDTTYEQPWFNFTEPGNYLLELEVTNACGTSVALSEVLIVTDFENNFIVGDSIICLGEVPNCLLGSIPVGGAGSYEYLWEQQSSGTFWMPVSFSGTGQNLCFPGPITETTSYRRKVTDANGTSAYSNVITIQALQAQVNQVPDIVLCNGFVSMPIIFSTSISGGVMVYYWTHSVPAIGLPASGIGSIPPFVPINTGPYPIVSTITVMPSILSGSVTCDGPPIAFSITVLPEIGQALTGEISGPQDVCTGAVNVPYSINQTPWATSYVWQLPIGATIASGAGTNSITVNFPGSTGSGIIKVTPSNDCGVGNPSPDFHVRINPPLSGTVHLNNIIVYPGMNGCIAADTIYTGGEAGIFTIGSGATVKLFAEEAIIMLPGTSVAEGGYLLAMATNSCLSCGNFKSLLANTFQDEEFQPDETLRSTNPDDFFRIYPNPTEGRFTLELAYDNPAIVAEILIYNTTGTVVGKSCFNGDLKMEMNLTDVPPGIYLVRVDRGTQQGMKKVVRLP